jgi:hypothetical protein
LRREAQLLGIRDNLETTLTQRMKALEEADKNIDKEWREAPSPSP